MTISRARKNFRLVLAGLLLLSLTFFLSVAGLYAAVRLKYVDRLETAHVLMKIDALQHQAKFAFVDQDTQYEIAVKMLRQSFFSPAYGDAGFLMVQDLAKAGHAPSQTLQADLILNYRTQTPENTSEAIAYYQAAADQGYLPARDKLFELQKLAKK